MEIYQGVKDDLQHLNRVEWKFRRRHLHEDTTPLDITSDKVRHGWKRTIQRVSVEGENFGCTAIRIGYINDHDEIGWYAEEYRPQAGVLYGMTGPVVLQAGDRLLVRFIGPYIDGNILSVYAEGFEEKDA